MSGTFRSPRAAWLAPASLLAALLAAVLGLVGCRPFAGPTERCDDAPCADGYVCVEGYCLTRIEPPPPPPPCMSAEDCAVDGSSDGRECVEGECGWVDCFADVQCGTRICDQDQCGPRTLCVGDEDCKDGGVCIDGTCRSPCLGDEDCPAGLLPQACIDGRCEQTCVIDFLCFGGICEEGLCTEPECGSDADCPTNHACNGGRCEQYTPCGNDEDCFDPDFFCNGLGRCEMRPACTTDADCGSASLCLADVCRPADNCEQAADCPDVGDECIAGRCVDPPGCRANDECPGDQICAGNACVDPILVTTDRIALETAHGVCESDGTGPCRVVLFVGESTAVRVGTFDENQHPVLGPFAGALDMPIANLATTADGFVVTATAVGTTTLTVDDGAGGAVHAGFTVRVIDGSGPEPVKVLVVDGATGTAVVGASVTLGDSTEASGADGLARFDPAPGPDANGTTGLTVTVAGREGLVLLGLSLSGNLRVVIPPPGPSNDDAAGVAGEVISTGDETGPVGFGIGLVGQGSLEEASLRQLFGPTFTGSLEAPLVGAFPVQLPAAVMMEATLPFSQVGNQIVKERTYGLTTPGRRTLTGFELRREVGDLLGSVLAADATDLALSLAADAEGMDVLVAPAGKVEALPLVVDGDLSDGIADIDGDGDTNERVPDWGTLPLVEMGPARQPRERVGLRVENPPAQSRGQLFAVGGLLGAGVGFVPTGMTTLSGNTDGTEQLRVAGPGPELVRARRAVRVEAVFDDPALSSAVLWRGPAFTPDLDLGGLLAPPEGTFVLEDVPTPGGRLLQLPSTPGATLYTVRVQSAAGRHLVVVPSTGTGGRSIALPSTMTGGIAVYETSAARSPGATNDDATLSLFAAGQGPLPSVLGRAQAVATVVSPE